jgi:cation transport ATPase
MKKITAYLDFDSVLLVLLLVVLALNYLDFLKFSYWKEILIGVAILATIPVVASAFDSLRAKKINIDTLAGTALIFAILNLEWISVIFINLMLTSSRIFLSYNERRARKSIEGLLKLKPKRIKVKGKDGKITEVTSKGVKVGDIVIVGLGERVPVDGTVVSGAATLDESSLTGESMPVAKSKGDEVFSSTLVVSGELEMKTEKIGAETTLEKIIALVEKAQLDKPEIRTTAEKFAGWYITITFIGAGIAYAVTGSLGFVLAIMLVVCADDIAVAVPLAFLTAISYAAKRHLRRQDRHIDQRKIEGGKVHLQRCGKKDVIDVFRRRSSALWPSYLKSYRRLFS